MMCWYNTRSMRNIVLASGSPRRQALLKQIGLKFTVDPDITEDEMDDGLEPHRLAKKLSQQKAASVAHKYKSGLIIAADTFGVFEGILIGKPKSANDARDILRKINGKYHSVITGLTVMDSANGDSITESVETRVYIKSLTEKEIDDYVKSGEPLDKAGAYAIQGLGVIIVDKIEGDYSNVIGLPLPKLAEILSRFGVSIFAE